jgi:transcription-repair coupling factor (superfamily II helicase)
MGQFTLQRSRQSDRSPRFPYKFMSTTDARQLLLPEDAYSRTRWGKLYGAAESLAVTEIAAAASGLLVVVAPSTTELLHLEVELRFFAGEQLPVHLLGDWETLTYDRVSPHQDIISQRIRTLYSLGEARHGILLLTAAALMQRLPPRSFLDQHALIIKQGDTLPLDDFRSRLVDAGYRLVTQVEEHGEFAVRGSILDLFPMSSNYPLRVEFFDDDIETKSGSDRAPAGA